MTRTKMFSALFFLIFLFIGPVWAAPFAYIPNASDNTVSIIDTDNNTVIDTITVGDYPIAITMTADGYRAYVLNKSTISVIDTTNNRVVKTISFTAENTINAIAVSPDGSRLYVSAGSIQVIDTYTDATIASIPVDGLPHGIVVSPNGSQVYAVDRENKNVVVINASRNQIETTIPVVKAPTGIAISPDGSRIYVTNLSNYNQPPNGGSVSVIDTTSNQVIEDISIGSRAYAIAVSPDGSRVYTGNYNTIYVIDTNSNSVITTISTVGYGFDIKGIAVTPDGSHVYVGNRASNNVSVIDTNTNSIVMTIPVGSRPYPFGIFIASGNTNTGPAPDPCDSTEPRMVDRMRVNDDNTITDTASGLMWQQKDDIQNRTWSDAKTFCEDLTLGCSSHSDWRLPLTTELEGLVDEEADNFSPISPVFYVYKQNYWTGVSHALYPDQAWVVSFNEGRTGYRDKNNTGRVICVRDGSGNDPYADTTKPNISLNSPTTGSTFSTTDSSITIAGFAGDNVQVSYVTCETSHGENITATGTINWNCLIPLYDTVTTVTVTAYDPAGNPGSKALTITKEPVVTNRHPQLEIVSAPSTATAGEPYTIELRATDEDDDLQSITVDCRSIGNVDTLSASEGQIVSFTCTYPRSGDFTWTATADDSSGASSYPVTQSVTVIDSVPSFCLMPQLLRKATRKGEANKWLKFPDDFCEEDGCIKSDENECRIVIDTFKDVPAYLDQYNDGNFHKKSSVYQCTEYVARYLYKKFSTNYTKTKRGQLNQDFHPNYEGVAEGGFPRVDGGNGTFVAITSDNIQPGDIVVFYNEYVILIDSKGKKHTTNGHVAVVKVVNSATAVLIEQNLAGGGYYIYGREINLKDQPDKVKFFRYLPNKTVITPEPSVPPEQHSPIVTPEPTYNCDDYDDVVEKVWFEKSVKKLCQEGIVDDSTQQKSFEPTRNVAKAEFLKMVLLAADRCNDQNGDNKCTAEDYPEVEKPHDFNDVGRGWFSGYVDYAGSNGIIDVGSTQNEFLFNPSQGINRAVAAKLLVNAFKDITIITNGSPSPFKDVIERDKTTDQKIWYYDYIYTVHAKGIVSGYSDGTFLPEKIINRAEASKMVCYAAYSEKQCK